VGAGGLRSCCVILSTVYAVARRLLALPTLLLRRDVSKEAELLVLRFPPGYSAVKARRSNARLPDSSRSH